MLRSCLGVIGILFLATALLITFSLGIGALLHWLIPSLDLGVGALLGLGSLLGSLYLIFVALPPAPGPDETFLELHPIDVIVPARRRRKKPPAP